MSAAGRPAGGPEPERADGPIPWQGRALLLGSIEVHRADNHVTCRVEILHAGRAFRGEDRELDTELGRARAAARATLRAAENAAASVSLGLEGAHLTHLFGRRYLIVAVEAAAGRRYAHLAGIVAVERSVEDAACLAALRAIERWAVD